MRQGRWVWMLAVVGCRADEAVDSTAGPADPIPDGVADAVADADADADSDADTDTDTDVDSETGTESTDLPDIPVTIELASVVCDGTVVEFVLHTTGRTDGARVFSQETGFFGAQWADTHDLESYESDPGGTWDHLALRLSDGSTLADPESDWVRNDSTAFTCAEHFGHGVMSFAFAAFDRYGNLADCLAYGNDAQGLLARSYDRASDPDFETSGCRIGVGVGLQ